MTINTPNISEEFMRFMKDNMEPYNKLITYYSCAIMEVETKFKVLNEELGLEYDRNPIESIKTRIKSNASLFKKLQDRHIPFEIDKIEANINDIAGVRIICSFLEDIYMLADCFLKQDDITLISRKDYIKSPKENGYRSLHLIVGIPIFLQNEKRMMKVEVQFRTMAMDFWASIEHKLKYKKNLPDDLAEEFAVELFECARISNDLDKRMQKIRYKMKDYQDLEE